MAKYKKQDLLSDETLVEAMKMAKATQKPNQNKEQTKLISQGIAKGIAEYKKQQKGKIRELNRLKKKYNIKHPSESFDEEMNITTHNCKIQWLPWILVGLSGSIIAVSLYFNWLKIILE